MKSRLFYDSGPAIYFLVDPTLSDRPLPICSTEEDRAYVPEVRAIDASGACVVVAKHVEVPEDRDVTPLGVCTDPHEIESIFAAYVAPKLPDLSWPLWPLGGEYVGAGCLSQKGRLDHYAVWFVLDRGTSRERWIGAEPEIIVWDRVTGNRHRRPPATIEVSGDTMFSYRDIPGLDRRLAGQIFSTRYDLDGFTAEFDPPLIGPDTEYRFVGVKPENLISVWDLTEEAAALRRRARYGDALENDDSIPV